MEELSQVFFIRFSHQTDPSFIHLFLGKLYAQVFRAAYGWYVGGFPGGWVVEWVEWVAGHVPDVRSCNQRQVGDAREQDMGHGEWMGGWEDGRMGGWGKVQESPGERTKHLSSTHRPLSRWRSPALSLVLGPCRLH